MSLQIKHKTAILILTATLILIVLPSSMIFASDKIVLVGSNDTKNSFTGRWLNLIYTEVFRRLEYEFEYKAYPNERANRMAEAGEVDGEIQRAAGYAKIARNLLKVEEESFVVTIAAYAVKPGIVLDSWQSLLDSNYSVEYRRGSKVAQNALPKVVKAENLSTCTTVDNGLKKLFLGRTDIYIEQQRVVLETLRKLEPSGVYQAGIMWTGTSHLYLHKRHAKLLPKIAKVLKEMKQEGLIERYKKIAEKAPALEQ